MTPTGALIDKENAVPRPGGASKPAQQLRGRRPLGVRDTNLRSVVLDRMESSKAAPPQHDGAPKRSSLGAGDAAADAQPSTVQRPASQQRGTWDGDLDKYLKPQGGSPGGAGTLRARLAEAVKKDSASPEAWWAFLQAEEAALCGSTATLSGVSRGGVTLFDLYHWATKLVPRQANYGSEAYVKIWLGYARQQWYKNRDDARDTFKTLRSQHIGDRSALLYYEWAALEQLAGNASKALSVLQKGLREQAQPAGLLEQMQQDLQAGKFVYRPPWAVGGSATGHSNATSFAAFQTPGGLDQRCGAAAATPTVDGSQLGRATETLVLASSRPAGTARQQSLPVASSKAGSSGGNNEQDTIIIAAKARAAGSSGSLAEHYARHAQSCNSAGSGEATATLRMPTPRAGASNQSNGSTGSLGEEATVSLRKPGSGGPAEAGSAGSDKSAGSARGGGDDTVIVNRSALLKAAVTNAALEGTAAKDPALPKPRRMGMLGLGRALRVTPGSTPAASAAADELEQAAASAEDADAANRKRKAEAEAAHSPKPPMATGDFKRRSPANEVKNPLARSQSAPEQPARPQRQLPPIPRFDGSKPPLPSGTATAAAAPPAAPSVAAAKPPAVAAAAAPRQQVVLGEAAEGAAGDEDEDETVPHVMSKLALKIAKGRQSLAPGKIVMRADGEVVGPNETSSSLGSHEETDDMPTVPLERPSAAGATSRAGEEDPEATRPLSRPAPAAARASPPKAAIPVRQVQIDGAGNVKLQQLQPAQRPVPAPKRMPVPPPPPPALSTGDEGRPAAGSASAAVAAGAPAPARVPMGPPAPMPPKHLRPQPQPGSQCHAGPEAAAAAQQAQQQPQQQRRRVIEDENTIVVKGITYIKLECVGRGGSSKVYKVMAPNRKIFALKRIRLSGRDTEAAAGFLDEITLLNKLKGRSNIIQLIDSEVHRSEGIIYMVLECGDIDLARLLQKHEKARQEHVNADEVDENFIRLYWEQMLQAVYSIHEERIVHSDLKPANFLMVEGQLKLIDFGIAKAIQADTTSIARESQVGTLNYMSPEAILGGQNNIRGGPPMKVGRPSDVWSLGCILYQMVYGHTPFSHLPFIQKMHAIIDANHRIAFPPIQNAALMDVMQRCLDRNPRSRITMMELLEHPFLRPTQPPPAAPASSGGAPGEVRLSKEQLTKLLLQVSQAGVANNDVGKLSEELFRQMANGLSPNVLATKSVGGVSPAVQQSVAGAVGRASTSAAAPSGGREDGSGSGSGSAAPARAQQQQQQAQQAAAQRPKAQPASVAEAAAQAAAARAEQRAAAVAAVESRPRAAAAGLNGGRAPLMPISQAAIAQQATALRKVEPGAHKAQAPRPAEGGLEAALRKGLERFHFDDTRGTTAHGDDTTGDFSMQ